MAKVLRSIVKVQAITSSIAAMIPGPWQPIAAANAMLMNIILAATKPKPATQGQVSGFLIGANNPMPYLMGEAYTEGVEIYRAAWGGKVGKVQNPYAFIPRVLSCCGPIQSMGSTWVDHEEVTLAGSVGSSQGVASGGYYEDYLWVDQQLGARPESDALMPPSGWGTPPNWSTAHKLSSMAAIAWCPKWDKDGVRFGGGNIPPLGKVPQGVKVYDPRLDSTYPGGSGSCRLGTESTYVYSANPALHAGTYAYGRKTNSVPVFGGRLFNADGVDWAKVVAWANTCDANGWTVNGTIYEPGDKWNNLERICEAGGAEPVLHNGQVTFNFQAPRTSLATVTLDDLATSEISSQLGAQWKDRFNTLVARYRSADHEWNYVQADEVVESTFLTEDGEEKTDERQWDLVTDVDQVTELAIYDLWQRREHGPFVILGKPHMRVFGPGDCLTLGADLGAHPDGAIKTIVRERNIDESGLVGLVLEKETDDKHSAALGTLGGAPVVPTLPSTSDMNEAWAVNAAYGVDTNDGYTTGTTTITAGGYTYQQVASQTVNARGLKLRVQVDFGLNVIDNCKYMYRIKFDGVTVRTFGPITVNTGDQPPGGTAISHTPSSGSRTYTLEVSCNDAGDLQVIDPLFQITENVNQ